jgi:hypothetical protein
MKKRKPDILYDGFKDKFFDHESELDPELKEKIFTDFYSEELKNKTNNGFFISVLTQFIADHRYAAAACFTGLLASMAIFYMAINLKEIDQVSLNTTERTELKENRELLSIRKEITESSKKQEHTTNIPRIRSSNEEDKKSRSVSYKTDKEKLIVFLPDSSKVYLNKYSELSYSGDFTNGERTVHMKGEVYFDVKKSKSRPFIVYSKIARIEVLGTSFSVKSLPDGKEEVIVESGQVLFAEKENKNKNKIILTPGMKAHLDPGKPIINLLSDHSNDLSWKTNKLTFNKTPIKDVIEKIGTYFDVQVKISDPKVLTCHFTGNFDHPESLEEVLEIISISINGSYEIKNNNYILTSKGCN